MRVDIYVESTGTGLENTLVGVLQSNFDNLYEGYDKDIDSESSKDDEERFVLVPFIN